MNYNNEGIKTEDYSDSSLIDYRWRVWARQSCATRSVLPKWSQACSDPRQFLAQAKATTARMNPNTAHTHLGSKD